MRHRRVLPSFVSFLLLVLMVATGPFPAGAGGRPPKADAYRASLDRINARFRTSADRAGRATGARFVPITNNFTVIGHTDLGASDTNGDVWVHGNFAYVGTWGDPCNGLGVKIIDVTNPANPVMLPTRVGGIAGTSAEDVVVRSVSTALFIGDLLAVGIQRCGGDPALDDDEFGVDFWNVTNPAVPVHLSFLGLTHGGGGVHELDLFQRGSNVYALLATPGSDFAPSDMVLRIVPAQAAWLEARIDALNDGLEPLRSFILPGGSEAAARVHVARAAVRRAERAMTALAEADPVNPAALAFVNRLSDYLFVLARAVNAAGEGDVLWQPGANR